MASSSDKTSTPTSKVVVGSSGLVRVNGKLQKGDKKTMICFVMQLTGKCKNGPSCPYSHDYEHMKAVKGAECAKGKKGDGKGRLVYVAVGKGKPSVAGRKICGFWLRGHCKKGKECECLHQSADPPSASSDANSGGSSSEGVELLKARADAAQTRLDLLQAVQEDCRDSDAASTSSHRSEVSVHIVDKSKTTTPSAALGGSPPPVLPELQETAELRKQQEVVYELEIQLKDAQAVQVESREAWRMRVAEQEMFVVYPLTVCSHAVAQVTVA
jgi:hypothetical protein